MTQESEPTDNASEHLVEDSIGIAERMTAATERLDQLPAEHENCLTRALARGSYGTEWMFLEMVACLVQACSVSATSYRVLRDCYEEYARIHQQLVWGWDTLTEEQLEVLAKLDEHLIALDKEIDTEHQKWALMRAMVMNFEAVTPMQIIMRDTGFSIRDDLRRIHEIVTEIQNAL